MSFLNLAASEETFAHAINIPLQGDDFDSIRVEYMTMLQNQLAKGNNGLIKTKYLTFGIDADSLKAAKPGHPPDIVQTVRCPPQGQKSPCGPWFQSPPR